MNVHLLNRCADLTILPDLPSGRRTDDGGGRPDLSPCEEALVQDLELETLLSAMADGDAFLLKVARRVLLDGPKEDPETVLYRQKVLQDCLRKDSVVRALYDIAAEAIERRQREWFSILGRYPSGILADSIRYLRMLVGLLRKLRRLVDEHAGEFESAGFQALFDRLRVELAEEYIACIEDHLNELELRRGTLVSAALGRGNEGVDYVLHRPVREETTWLQRLFGKKTTAYTYHLHPRDEAGARAVGEIRSMGIRQVAVAAAQSADHIAGFFATLRAELAFYLGCVNLYRRLGERGVPVCFPVPRPAGTGRHSARGLRDVCLALTTDAEVVGNELPCDGMRLVVVTGVNQGGKTCFLRSIGVAQLMMQAGMFVAAEAFQGDVCPGLFTHSRREEDAKMEKGKLDEELERMSRIVDRLRPGALVLLNESFSSTNEREASEIARQTIGAMLETGMRVVFVTHLYAFARRSWEEDRGVALFLRPERRADGQRTFRIVPGEPLETSFAADLYERAFGNTGDGSEEAQRTRIAEAGDRGNERPTR